MPNKILDPEMLQGWQPTSSGDARLTLGASSAGKAPALQMDFAFNDGGGFVVAKRELQRLMPEEYSVRFRLRGRGAVINLELKLVDDTGRNVWRHVIKDLQLPARWKTINVESREIDFAWGPAGSGGISQLGSIELAIVTSKAAQGTLWIADLRIEDSVPSEPPRLRASSELPDFPASGALTDRGWAPHAEDAKPWLVIDLTAPRRIGGLIIEWRGDAPASGFRIGGSGGGAHFKTVYTAASAGGKRSYVYLPGTHCRYLRLDLKEPCAGATLHLQSFEFSRSIDAFWHRVAGAQERGWHPRWLHREQSVWTPIGTSHGTQCALMNADGMVEVAQGSFSIEPMLWCEGRLYTWADIAPRQELRDRYLPVPSVIWETPAWRLRIEAEATGTAVLRVRYQLENLTGAALRARLFVLMRPFQVTPPWQSFRNLGGVSRIHSLEFRDAAVHVNETTRIVPMDQVTAFAALSFDQGFMAPHLAVGALPRSTAARDRFGFATGALEFELSPGPHQRCDRTVSCLPLTQECVRDEPAFDWGARLASSQWAGHGWMMEAVHTALTATAHILVTRSGPALQPGPRRYTRSWIRDGAMMSAALLRMGHTEEVREFIRWYAPHQRADGFVPCCVDAEGTDWLVEHDSHGQLIALIADSHRFHPDDDFLRESWPFLEKAVACINGLLDPTGLLPISVSHEGYLAQPVHSYWDDFWGLRGLCDAVEMARALGEETSAERWSALRTRFAASLFASIEATRAERKLAFIPGSIEWADFDPTATANALYLFDVAGGLNRTAVEQTFDTYLVEWHKKRSGAVEWANYTPYEIRIIGALVRLGRRAAALELLQFFLSDRRPQPWNQWPEIAWRDAAAPAHLGDLPHTWIAAEYVLALRSLIAYEREADQSLILAAGIAPEWIECEGVQVNRMPTLRGSLSYSLRKADAGAVQFKIGAGITGRVILRPPLAGPLRRVIVDGSPWADFDLDSVTLHHTPAEVTCIAGQ